MMQEFNRESNTLASKSINAEVTNSAIELKVLIEQMREQIQNIEYLLLARLVASQHIFFTFIFFFLILLDNIPLQYCS